MRVTSVVLMVLAAAGAACALASAAGPPAAKKGYRLPGQGISFSLPSNWLGASGAPTGPLPRFKGQAPGSVATLVVLSFKESATLTAMAPALKKALLGQYANDDPHATVTRRDVVVDGTPAVQFVAHYRGIWRSGKGQMTDVIEFFFHRGVLYDFDYRSVAPWTPKYLPAFAASAKSIRLT